MPKAEPPEVTITLAPGQYLVDVVGGSHPRARVWRHDSMGVVEGYGARLRRPSLVDLFRDMTIKAEQAEGIWPGGPVSSTLDRPSDAT